MFSRSLGSRLGTPFNGVELATTKTYYYLSATPVSVYDGNYVCRTLLRARTMASTRTTCRSTSARPITWAAVLRVESGSDDRAAWVMLQVMFKNAAGNTIATLRGPSHWHEFREQHLDISAGHQRAGGLGPGGAGRHGFGHLPDLRICAARGRWLGLYSTTSIYPGQLAGRPRQSPSPVNYSAV